MEEHSYTRKESVENYDLLRDLPEEIKLEYAKSIIDLCKGNSILDLGFGTGNTLIYLSKINKSFQIYGVDNSKEMCIETKKKLGDGAEIFQGELGQFVDKFGKIDLLHFKAILHCVKNPEELIEEIMDAVKPGGCIVTSHEFSQTEDRIEQIFNYKKIDDKEVEMIFEYYFKLRNEIGVPFNPRRFPAGNSNNVADYIIKTGNFTKEKEIVDEKLSWKRDIKILDILNAIKKGTFGVFFDGVSEKNREEIYTQLVKFSKENSIDIDKRRPLPSSFKINVLRKVI